MKIKNCVLHLLFRSVPSLSRPFLLHHYLVDNLTRSIGSRVRRPTGGERVLIFFLLEERKKKKLACSSHYFYTAERVSISRRSVDCDEILKQKYGRRCGMNGFWVRRMIGRSLELICQAKHVIVFFVNCVAIISRFKYRNVCIVNEFVRLQILKWWRKLAEIPFRAGHFTVYSSFLRHDSNFQAWIGEPDLD